jgi:hypothetical protein
MCFSEKTSLYNFLILSFYGYYLQFNSNDTDIWRLFIPLYYLSLKDLLQYFLYREKNKYIFGVLSWVHICFQPLIVNMLLSYFSKSTRIFNKNYWKKVKLSLFHNLQSNILCIFKH